MNLSQANPVLATAWLASLEHEEDGVVATPPPLPIPLRSVADFLRHKKKFLDPREISFSSLSKPEFNHTRVTKHRQYPAPSLKKINPRNSNNYSKFNNWGLLSKLNCE